MAKKFPTNWLFPGDVVDRNRILRKDWGARHVGYLYMLRLVCGAKLKRSSLVCEPEVLQIYKEFVTHELPRPDFEQPRMIRDWVTPKQFLERNPGIAKTWDDRAIGYIFMLGLVKGRKFGHSCMCSEAELVYLYKRWVCRIGM